MNTPRAIAAFLLLAPAWPAKLRPRVDISFCRFVPPLLLCRRPNFRRATACATKRNRNVKSPLDKLRHAVTLIGSEYRFVHRCRQKRTRIASRFLVSAKPFYRARIAPVFDCRAALFIALHRDRGGGVPLGCMATRPCSSGNRPKCF